MIKIVFDSKAIKYHNTLIKSTTLIQHDQNNSINTLLKYIKLIRKAVLPVRELKLNLFPVHTTAMPNIPPYQLLDYNL